jgi:hypothetical protein
MGIASPTNGNGQAFPTDGTGQPAPPMAVGTPSPPMVMASDGVSKPSPPDGNGQQWRWAALSAKGNGQARILEDSKGLVRISNRFFQVCYRFMAIYTAFQEMSKGFL